MIRAREKLHSVLCLTALLIMVSMSAFASDFIVKYEQVVTDSYGNEVGYRTTTINDINDLPPGSPWRDYLNLELNSGKSIFEYGNHISKSLNRDFTLTISDRDSNSYSFKDKSGYNIHIFNYVNDYATDASKRFLFLHEFGHVAMLNSYPSNYDFRNLDYGSDGAHYLDEILPNANTAWVEGWANAFGAYNNGGMVFSVDINKPSSLAFLKKHSFEEMSRNELFITKVMYDFMKDIPGGQASVFDTISKTGPHYSLYDFCKSYTTLYPQNKAAVASVLMKDSFNGASLKDILTYVNGGSNKVSRDLYNSLVAGGLVDDKGVRTPSKPAERPAEKPAAKPRRSIFARFFGWIKSLFGFGIPDDTMEACQSTMFDFPVDGNVAVKGSVTGMGYAAGAPVESAPIENSIGDGAAGCYDADSIVAAQKEYDQCLEEYKALLSDPNSSREDIEEAARNLKEAGKRLSAVTKG